jgi:hypothetical protein
MLVAGTLVIAGCPGDLMRPSPPSLLFKGNVAGTLGLGTIAITVTSNPTQPGAANPTVSASATVRVRSGYEVFELTGTYDPSARVLALGGSGWTVSGTLSNGVLRGNFAATGGAGVFIALGHGAGADAVTTYCAEDGLCFGSGAPSSFRAGLGVRGPSVVGVAYSRALPDTLITFVGSYSATDSSLLLVDPANPTGPPLGTGRLRTNWAQVRFLTACDWAGNPCQ